MTKEFTEHADRISGKTFVDMRNYYKNRDKFIHCVIHESMHLCFKGFNENILEEGLIEYFIEKMFEKFPSNNFSYTPVSDTYKEWKENFKVLFKVLPDAEKHFTTFFLTQDIRPLNDFLKSHLSHKTRKEIVDKHYTKGISIFINSLMKLIS